MNIADAPFYRKQTLKDLRDSWTMYSKPPPRHRSPYVFYISAYYKYFRQRLQTNDPAVIIAALARRWKMFNEDRRKEYVDLSVADKERYKSAMAEWKLQFKDLKIVPRMQRRRKNRAEPKRTRNPYIFYQYEALPKLRETYKTMQQCKLIQMMAGNWRKMTKVEREPYIHQSKEDKGRYRREIREYKEESRRLARQLALQLKEERLEMLKRRRRIEKLGVDKVHDTIEVLRSVQVPIENIKR